MRVRCPHCHNQIELVEDSGLWDIVCPSCGSSFSLLDETVSPEKQEARSIGHFELIEQVGVGGFGSVWKANDKTLDRTVAVKIPRKRQLDSTETESFLREARSAAQLSHPNIVAVHEVGREEGQVYIVSEFVEGLPLSSWLTASQPTVREAAELTKKIAEALHHAHEAGVIHVATETNSPQDQAHRRWPAKAYTPHESDFAWHVANESHKRWPAARQQVQQSDILERRGKQANHRWRLVSLVESAKAIEGGIELYQRNRQRNASFGETTDT